MPELAQTWIFCLIRKWCLSFFVHLDILMKHFHPALLMILQVTGFYWYLVQNFLYSSSNFCIHIEEANRTFFLAESSKNWIKLLDLSQSDCERFWSHWSLLCQIVHLIILILPAKNTLQSGILNWFFFLCILPKFCLQNSNKTCREQLLFLSLETSSFSRRTFCHSLGPQSMRRQVSASCFAAEVPSL